MNLSSVLLLIILITIGWAYYSLAKRYNRRTILYMVFGVGTFIFVVLLNALLYTFFEFISHNIGKSTHRLIAFLLGIFVVVLIHYALEKRWLKEKNIEAEEAIEEIGKD